MAPTYITRARWGAKHGPNDSVGLPYLELIAHTIAGGDEDPMPGFQALPRNASLDDICQRMRNIESFHVRTRGWPGGVGYNHVVFPAIPGHPDGVICEGQGWGRRGTHTESRNSQWGVCFYGHGDQGDATPEQWSAAQWLIRLAVANRYLVPAYRVSGHRNYSTKGKSCPGNLIYPQLNRLRGLSAAMPNPPEDEIVDQEQEDRIVARVREEILVAVIAVTGSQVSDLRKEKVFGLPDVVADIKNGTLAAITNAVKLIKG